MTGANARAPGEPASDVGLDVEASLKLGRRSQMTRVGFAALCAVVSVAVLPWREAAAWIAMVGVWELVSSRIIDRAVARLSEDRATNAFAAVNFLHVSQKEQHRRFLDRIVDPDDNWKFSPSDWEETHKWDAYQDAYQEALRATSKLPRTSWLVARSRGSTAVSFDLIDTLFLSAVSACSSRPSRCRKKPRL